MALEIVILSEVREEEILYNIPYMWNLIINNTDALTKEKEMHRLREWTYSCQRKGQGEGIVKSLGYTSTNCYICNGWLARIYYMFSTCLAHGTLLSVMWQPGWERYLGENEYMYMYGWVPSLFTWDYHIVNQLYLNKK